MLGIITVSKIRVGKVRLLLKLSYILVGDHCFFSFSFLIWKWIDIKVPYDKLYTLLQIDLYISKRKLFNNEIYLDKIMNMAWDRMGYTMHMHIHGKVMVVALLIRS